MKPDNFWLRSDLTPPKESDNYHISRIFPNQAFATQIFNLGISFQIDALSVFPIPYNDFAINAVFRPKHLNIGRFALNLTLWTAKEREKIFPQPEKYSRGGGIWTERVSSRPSFTMSNKFYLDWPCFISTELYRNRVLSLPNCVSSTKFYMGRTSFISIEFYLVDQVLSGPTEVSSRQSYISTYFYLVDQVLSGPTQFHLDRFLSGRTSFIWTDLSIPRPSLVLQVLRTTKSSTTTPTTKRPTPIRLN